MYSESAEAAAGMMILLVLLEVFGQVRDTRREQSDLNFGRTSVAFVNGEFLHNLLFCLLV